MQYFEDVPVELLPDMLITIQKYSNYHVPENTPPKVDDDNFDVDVEPLSIMYEILQILRYYKDGTSRWLYSKHSVCSYEGKV